MDSRIKPIRSGEDYRQALAIIDTLIDADPESEEYRVLDIVSELVYAYEEKNVEIPLPDPIEAIKFRLDALGLTLRDLRPYIGSDARVSEVMSGKRDLSLKMVRALHTHLGIPLESLIHERSTDLAEDPEIGMYPIPEMMKLGWTGSYTNPKGGQKEEAWNWVRVQARADEFQSATLCRQNSQSYANAKTDMHSLYAWCLRVRALAFAEELPGRFEPGMIDQQFLSGLARLSMSADGPERAKRELNRIGVHIVIAKHLRGTFLDGAAMLLEDNTPVIGITLRHDRLDNFWHCLLHECVHVWKHLGKEDAPSFFHDDFDVHGDLNDAEQEADRLACEALIPDQALDALGNLNYASASDIRRLAKEFSVHEAVVAGRIRFRTGNYTRFGKLLGYGEPSRILGVSG